MKRQCIIKAHQINLTRWCDRLTPFHFQIENIPGSKIGLTDYISRHGAAKPTSMYDVKAQIDAIVLTIYVIKHRMRPQKLQNLNRSRIP